MLCSKVFTILLEAEGEQEKHRNMLNLKGQCHEIFHLLFFIKQLHLGPDNNFK
jgi:hypothetical protein